MAFTKRPGFAREVTPSSSPDIAQAERVIFTTYGDTVSVFEKGKNLNKFGVNLTVGTSFETVGEMQGTEVHETFVSTNLIDSVVSSSASDTQTVTIQGHTVDVSGNLTFVSQTADLSGQTEVPLITPLARASRMYINASGTFDSPQAVPVGIISVYDNTDGETSGVPNTDASTKLLISAGESQTQKCSTSTASDEYWIITAIDAGIGNTGGNAARVQIKIETRDIPNGGVWRPLGRELILVVGQNGVQVDPIPYLIVPPSHDIRVVARTNSNTASVFAELRGMLASIQ